MGRVTRLPGDWTERLGPPVFTHNDSELSEGRHGEDAQAWAPEVPSRWPLYILEAGSASWQEGHYWRRRKSGRIAVEVVTGGDLRFRQNGRDYLVSPGQAIILQHGSDHVYATGPAGFVNKRYLTLVGPAAQMLLGLSGLDRVDVVDLDDPLRVVALLKEAYRLLHTRPAQFEQRLSVVAYEVCSALVASLSPRRSALVQAAAGLMQRNLHRTFSNTELAVHAGATAGYVVRQFRVEFGRTPLKYHMDMRITLAQRLLQTTPLAIKHVAARTGFDDPLYFSRVFTRAVGMSPRMFRSAGGRIAAVAR